MHALQLTPQNYVTAVSLLAQVIERSVNDTNRQDMALLSTTAGYLRSLSEFVGSTSNLMINISVSSM